MKDLKELAIDYPEVTFASINVLTHREVSNQVAQMTGIEHQSPQLFFFEKGQMRWHAEHTAISRAAVEALIT